MPYHMYGWYRWRGKDLVNVGIAHANIAYDRSDVQSGLGGLDRLINYCKNNQRAISFRLRAIPWYTGIVPPSNVIHLYVAGSHDGGTLYLPRYELEEWWVHYTNILKTTRDRIVASGLELAFFDIDGLGRGGEAHFHNVIRPPGYIMPTRAHRKRASELAASMFGPAKLVVPTDNAEQVLDAFALHPDLGWRRDSLGRAHFKDGCVKKGIWEPMKQRARNPRAMIVAEWYGTDPPVSVAMGFDQIKESGTKLVGNGNFGVNADNNNTYLSNNAANFQAISDYLLSQRTAPAPLDPQEPTPAPTPTPVPTDPIPPAVITDPPDPTTASRDTITLATPAAVRGLTLAVTREELYAFTDSPSTYRWTPDGTLTPGAPTGTATNRAIRSGEGEFVYVATDGALQKWFPFGSCYDVRLMTAPQQCLAVGYSSALQALPKGLRATVYRVPWGQSGGADRFWIRQESGTWIDRPLPRAGWFWYGISVNPNNPDQILILGSSRTSPPANAHDVTRGIITNGGQSPLYYSADGGQSWNSVTLPSMYSGSHAASTTGFPRTYAGIDMIQWSSTESNQWVCVAFKTGDDKDTTGSTTKTSLYYGAGGSVTSGPHTINALQGGALISGAGGDLVLATVKVSTIGGYHGYSPANGSTLNAPSTAQVWNGVPGKLARGPGASRVLAIPHDGKLYASSDYRSAAAVERVASGAGTSAAALASGWVFGGRSTIGYMADLFSGTTITTIPGQAETGRNILEIVSDRRTYTIAGAGITNSNNIMLTDGVTVEEVGGPEGFTTSIFSGAIDVMPASSSTPPPVPPRS